MAGSYRPGIKRILIDGKEITAIDRTSWFERLGIVSQDVFLFHESIYNNVAYVCPDASKEEIISALNGANAMEFVNRLPQGLETVVGDRGVRLSGEEKQRIAIARTLLHNPEILILDEVTSALDPVSEHKVQGLCVRFVPDKLYF